MNTEDLIRIKARENLVSFRENLAPVQGIIIGLDETGQNLIQAYFIRNKQNNNLFLTYQESFGDLRVGQAGAMESKNVNFSPAVYKAMSQRAGLYIVSNGQTDMIFKSDQADKSFSEIIFSPECSPGFPDRPRLSAVCNLRESKPYAEMSIVRRSDSDESQICHLFKYEKFFPGIGNCLTTGSRCPKSRPYFLPLLGDINQVIQTIWEARGDGVMLIGVKFINLRSQESCMKIIS